MKIIVMPWLLPACTTVSMLPEFFLNRINPTRKKVNTGIIRALGYAASDEMRTLIQEYIGATVSFIARPAHT